MTPYLRFEVIMIRNLEKVAVLGAGTMGARIAAHLANAGFRSFLLDIVPDKLTEDEQQKGFTLASPAVRNRIVLAGLEAARKARPAAFFTPGRARLITTGNFEDNLGWVAEADWIIEAVAERLDIKRALLARVDALRRPGTFVSTNTSGLPVRLIAEGFSEDFRRHWVGTHFFNPPRYMKLVEIIPTPETDPAVIETLRHVLDRMLGKGVVIAKDTPNFIANRIGTYSVLNVMRRMQEDGLTIEEVDALTGAEMGWPKSATFRTVDIVGLDVLSHVVRNLYQNAPHDERRETFRLPAFVEQMLSRGWLGDKTGQGFFKRIKKDGESEILTLDYQTLDYRPRQKAKFPSLEMAKQIEDPARRLATVVGAEDKGGKFAWKVLSDMLTYAAARIPEIADTVEEVDRAMRWGFNWEMGPFEMWDALGVEPTAERIRRQGGTIPPVVEQLLSSGAKSFYRSECGSRTFFDLVADRHRRLEERPGILVLKHLKEKPGAVIQRNAGASLVNLGDGVACVEYHSKMNAIGADIVHILHAGLKKLKEDFRGLVIGNQAANFSVGANLMLLLVAAQEGDWDEIDLAVRSFQGVNMAIKYAPRPVVAAPFGMSLGGGCETPLHAARIHAAAECYIGLVEAGVGLIPAGGGCKEMLIRANERAASGEELDLGHALKEVFEQMALGKVATSAEEAKAFGYLRPTDRVSMNAERLIADAKQTAIELDEAGWRPPVPAEIKVLGQSALSLMKLAAHIMKRAGYATDHDAVVAGKLAHVLAGGPLSAPQTVSEQYVLDLEREAFLSLCGERKTLERIQFTLKTGKPLRN